MYIRINDSSLFKGRYWLQTRVMTDGRELFQRICDLEFRIHPDTLKARARRVNSEYLEAEGASGGDRPKSRRHDRKGKSAKDNSNGVILPPWQLHWEKPENQEGKECLTHKRRTF